MNYSFLQGYWDTARRSHSYWGECGYLGHRLVVVTLEWPPKEVRQARGDAVKIRHFVFDFGSGSSIRSADTPVRSLNYEPNTGGPGVFLGETLSDGVRINHGQIPEMAREEFWALAFTKLFGTSLPTGLSLVEAKPGNAWWKIWK